MTVKAIARELGFKPSWLYDYDSKGYLHREKEEGLAEWLRSKGFLTDTAEPNVQEPMPSLGARALAGELRTLADYLESDLSGNLKARKFERFIAGILADKEVYIGLLKKA
jgi:hypothetical protein